MLRPFGEPWRAWLALLVGILAVTAQTASSITVSVLMKSILGEFGWSRTEFASATTVRILAMVTVMPFAGNLTDRFGARGVLGLGAFLVGICVWMIPSVQSLPALLAINVAMGPGQALIGSVAASALVLRLFDQHRSLAVGILNGADNLLNSALPLAVTSLLVEGGWRLPLRTLGYAYFGLVVLILTALRRDDGRDLGREGVPAIRASLKQVRQDRRLWAFLFVFATVYSFITSLQLHFHAFQTDAGRSPEVAAQLLSIQILVGAVGAPLFGWLAGRASGRTAILICVAGLAVSAAAVGFLSSLPLLVGWAIFHGVVNSGSVALLALVLHEIAGGANRIGGLLGLTMSVCMAATVASNQLAAGIFDYFHSYQPAWVVYAGLLAVAFPIAYWMRNSTGAQVELSSQG